MTAPPSSMPIPTPSTYLTPDYYDRLREDVAAWTDPGEPVEPQLHRQLEALLTREARLIDDDRLEEWLELFSEDCLYWVPTDPVGADPDATVAIAFDDRRRLEDRIAWLRTGHVYAQQPRSKTVHLVGNVEAWWVAGSDDQVRVRSHAVVYEHRNADRRVLAMRCGHVLRRGAGSEGRWSIVRKVVFLHDADAGQRNLTFVL
jgi:3-phenylpropionate/cinnamic acid dioxygenase small subunit